MLNIKKINILLKYSLFIYLFLVIINPVIFSQNSFYSNKLNLTTNNIIYNFSNYHDLSYENNKIHNISYNSEFILNDGHANIDNNGEFYSPSKFSKLISFRFRFANSWTIIELEPYSIYHSNFINKESIGGSMAINNNHVINIPGDENNVGLKQSRVILHYKGFGLGYGNMSHWWGPGFHSSLSLSSNAPSQETFSIGSFKDWKIGRFSFGSKIIALPYKSKTGAQLYFTGLKSHLSISYPSTIISLGFHRTYLSGDFSNLSSATSVSNWTITDAIKLVAEPLFGQSKKSLDYTIDGTPGFDYWDELLSGFINFKFINENLDIYLELASDDNRGNFTDLRAHWDHTLAYLIGAKKFFKHKKNSYFIGLEYLSTKISNTFNPLFYRGDPNSVNYYTKQRYDYFSYKGRRMGAHSGSSSDDFIISSGLAKDNKMLLLSYNKERHGIKTMEYPEIKSELIISFQQKLSKKHQIFITFENEHIRNFAYKNKNFSSSKLIWVGYTIFLN